MSLRSPPLILDFDGSVLKFSDDEIRIPLRDRQEEIRFGCGAASLDVFRELLPDGYGCAFLGSGDYHHLSLPLLKRTAEKNDKFVVVVCDNHPDNMRYPFGIHCGSWVYHASRLPQIERIHVIGVTSDDITAKHCWENRLSPLMRGRVCYWSVGKNAGWLGLIGAARAHRDFAGPDELADALVGELADTRKIYLSVDKDVFSRDVVETNWDQGCFAFGHVGKLIEAFRDRLVGMDVTGEVSSYQFRGWFKKTLTKWDGLEEPDPAKLAQWQERHREVNEKIWHMTSQ